MATKTKKTVEQLEETLNQPTVVETVEQLEGLISRVKRAQKIYSTFSQEQVDKIVAAASL